MIWLIDLLAVAGSIVLLLSTLGLVKFKDGWMQLASTSKTSTLGLFLVFLSASLHPVSENYRIYLWSCFLFFLIATPVSAHILGRAALDSGEKPSAESKDLRGSQVRR